MRNCASMGLAAIVAVRVAGCSDGDDGSATQKLLAAARYFEAYDWNQVGAGKRWQARAGLQNVDLNGRFYALGGRSPRDL